MKVDKLDACDENETFYTMFGEAAKLRKACSVSDNIWHISVFAHEHHQARLLKLKVYFTAGVCFLKDAENLHHFLFCLMKSLAY